MNNFLLLGAIFFAAVLQSGHSAPSQSALGQDRICESGKECPNGCCPFAAFTCCEDGASCAIRPEDCQRSAPDASTLIQLTPSVVPLAEKTQSARNPCETGKECPNGCCPFLSFTCCDDESTCAIIPQDCKRKRSIPEQVNLEALSVKDSTCNGGKQCPQGCCPFSSFTCCDDGTTCAISPNDCKRKDAVRLVGLEKREGGCSSGQLCGSGCCPFNSWICCPGQNTCGLTVNDCQEGCRLLSLI